MRKKESTKLPEKFSASLESIKLDAFLASLIVFCFGMIFIPKQTIPKIFADEIAGIDAVRHLLNSDFPNYSNYSIGPGLLLSPFYLLTKSPLNLYYISLSLNVIYLLLAIAIVTYVLRVYVKKPSFFLITCGFAYTGVTAATTRAMTESFSTFFGALLILKWTRIRNTKDYGNLDKIFLPLFIATCSLVHTRLFMLAMVSVIYEFWLRRKSLSLNSNLIRSLFACTALIVMQIINYIIKGPQGNPEFYSAPKENFLAFIINFLIIFFQHIFVLVILTAGSLLLLIPALSLKRRNQESGPQDHLLLDTSVLMFFAVSISALFYSALSVSSVWGETVNTMGWATRYFDFLIPFLIISILALNQGVPNRHLNPVLPNLLSLALVAILVVGFTLSLVYEPLIRDPIRSPLIFSLFKGIEISKFQILSSLIALIILATVAKLLPKLALPAISAIFLLAAVMPVAWVQNAENGFQKNHALVTTVTDSLNLSNLNDNQKCIEYVSIDSNNWWTAFNYRYWSSLPIFYGDQENTCALLVTDDPKLIKNREIIGSEEQATTFYLVLKDKN